MDATTYEKCSTCDARADRAGNRVVANALAEFMKKNHVKLAIQSGDVSITTRLPNAGIDTGHSCSKRAEARDISVTAKMVNNNAMLDSLDIGYEEALQNAIVVGIVPHEVTVSARIRVRFGIKIAGHCNKIGRKTCGVTGSSKGENTIFVSLAASDVSTAMIAGKEYLQFVLDVQVIDETKPNTYSSVSVPKGSGCNINILGIKVGSINSNIQKYANSYFKGNAKISELRGARLVKKLEDVLKARLGSTVTIPINVTGGGRKKRSAVPGCKRMKCPSGFSRIGNTQRCHKPMGTRKPDCSKYGPKTSVVSKKFGTRLIYWCQTDMIPA
eukprot:GFUD01003679.1.p1 GENE.GFUD01003679.1~~GFUD01003679.1.p1  ORF type:complete len:369 (+),score=54.22 GFUD01003679.1:124-1107(+)